jgi:hypothetical protein
MITDPFLDLVRPFKEIAEVDVVCQYCCLQIPDNDNGVWDICFPDVIWHDNTWVIMHCQDFLNVNDDGCRELKLIEQYFGANASRVIVVVWNIDLESVYSGPLNLVYVPYHSYEIIVSLLNRQDQWHEQLLQPRTMVFQSLNGVPKSHRVETVRLLTQFEQGIVSSEGNPISEFTYQQHLSVSNDENFVRLLPVYSKCDVNVVTESLYDYCPGIITEKTLFAWLALQVPILIGYQGIVSHARKLGYDMFDDIVDNSYDNLPNRQRVAAAIKRNQHLLKSGIDRSALLPRLLKNQQHVLEWPSRIIESYRAQLSQIISSM